MVLISGSPSNVENKSSNLSHHYIVNTCAKINVYNYKIEVKILACVNHYTPTCWPSYTYYLNASRDPHSAGITTIFWQGFHVIGGNRAAFYLEVFTARL